MATDDFAEKTESATPKKRGDARRKGQIPISKEMQTALILLAFAGLFTNLGSGIVSGLRALTRSAFETIREPVAPLYQNYGQALTSVIIESAFTLAFPLLLSGFLIAVVIGMLQTKFLFAPEKLIPDLMRLNPGQGWKKFFSMRSVVKVITAIFKFILLGSIVWLTLQSVWESAVPLVDADIRHVVDHLGGSILTLLWRVAGSLLVLSIFDLLYQRWQFEKDLKMTKEEVKEEGKQSEGNPEVKRRIRQRQREFSRNRMIAEVETATVVIVNPTHYAVALRYDEGEDPAPQVVAKGQGYIALRIRAAAERANCPVVHKPELARLLYRQAEVGSEIPESLFRAIAEILALLIRRPQTV